jgi:DNA-binding transcriptional ArsR family regulator
MRATGDRGDSQLSSADVFAILGNETRVQIIHALAEADGPLSFTKVRTRVGLEQGTQFNYHLEKLVGHFVTKTEEGYSLTRPGERVVEAVLSGLVTDAPSEEQTMLDEECYHCGAPIVVTRGSHLGVLCTECQGNVSFPASATGDGSDRAEDKGVSGFLRGFELPPAGMQGRSGLELLRAGNLWSNLEVIAISSEVCPRCSAPLDGSLRVCDAHERGGDCCAECGHRYAVKHIHDCTTCNYARMRHLGVLLLGKTEVLDFLTDHDINPIATDSPMSMRGILDGYEEEVIATEPVTARLTFRIGDDALTVTVDDELSVVQTRRQDTSAAA